MARLLTLGGLFCGSESEEPRIVRRVAELKNWTVRPRLSMYTIHESMGSIHTIASQTGITIVDMDPHGPLGKRRRYELKTRGFYPGKPNTSLMHFDDIAWELETMTKCPLLILYLAYDEPLVSDRSELVGSIISIVAKTGPDESDHKVIIGDPFSEWKVTDD